MGIHIMVPLFDMVVPGVEYEVTLARMIAASGIVYRFAGEQTWNQIRNGPGTHTYGGTPLNIIYMNLYPYSPNPLWLQMNRGIMCFDASDIPLNAIIARVRMRLPVTHKVTEPGVNPDICVVSANPASPGVELVPADYGTLGVTPLSNILAYDDIVVGEWNELELDEAGIDAINKGGITALGLRNYNHDAIDSEPVQDPGSSYITIRNYSSPLSDQCRLVVTYTSW